MSMIVPIVGVLVAAFVLPPAWGAVLLIGVVGWELGEKFFWIRLISRYPVTTGREALIGLPVTATTVCCPHGRVRLRGETRQARCSTGARPGDTLIVQSVDLITLIVERQHPRPDTADGGATSLTATGATAAESPLLSPSVLLRTVLGGQRYARPSSVGAALAIVASCLGPLAGSNDPAAATGRAVSGVTVLTPRRVVPGPRLIFHWPSTGEAAVAVAGVGVVGAAPNERKVAVASLTKMMTALVVLHDHPLVVGQAGPSVAISPSDVRDWQEDVRVGNSSVEVKAGETLTEYQLLEALLIPSADNIADRLAIWDAGSPGAFVQKMNLTARALGLRSTSYVDPSGVDPGSASSAADQAFVASKLMADPVAARIVGLQRIDLPVVGILANRNPALAVDGILGVKGGYSSHARSCLVTAAYRVHHSALVISVALGQADPIHAARIDEALLEKTTQRLRRYRLAPPSAEVATLTGPPGAPSIALVGPAASPTAVVWPGLALGYAFSPRSARALRSPQPGSLVGALTVSTAWGALRSIPVKVATAPGRRR